MNVNITAYLIFIACGAVLCAAWFFLDDRKENPGKNSALLAVLVLVVGALHAELPPSAVRTEL